MTRGVLIGCGFFAQNHLHAWAGIEGAEIVAVCDLDRDRAEAAAARFGAQAFTDAEAMLAETAPDFADVATTSGSHRALVELACRHGAAAICQKPFADTLEDAEAMVAAADAAGVPLLVHENFRWQRGFVEMRRRIAEGAIGRPRFARISFRHGFDVYAGQPYLARVERLAIMDVGLHLYDLSRHLMGEVDRLTCHTQRRDPKVRGEDAFATLLAHEDGATTLCDCSFASTLDPDPFPGVAALVEGDGGTLALSTAHVLSVQHRGRHETLEVEPEVPPWGGRPWHVVQDSVIAFQRHALAAIEGRAEPQPSGRDNLATLRLALASYDSAERSETVRLADWRP